MQGATVGALPSPGLLRLGGWRLVGEVGRQSIESCLGVVDGLADQFNAALRLYDAVQLLLDSLYSVFDRVGHFNSSLWVGVIEVLLARHRGPWLWDQPRKLMFE